jgi:DNA-binding LacI/PurR family transcriptional regulator
MTKRFSKNRFQQEVFQHVPRVLKTRADRFACFQTGLIRGNPALLICDRVERKLNGAGSFSATKRLLSIPDPPDAITCVNDKTASRA